MIPSHTERAGSGTESRSPLKQDCEEGLGIHCGNLSVSDNGHCFALFKTKA